MEGVFDAIGAERALVGADSGIRRGRREVGVAQFAVRAQSEHVWDATGDERADLRRHRDFAGPPLGGVRGEDLLVVTDEGSERLTGDFPYGLAP
jgi:hypothetical protein